MTTTKNNITYFLQMLEPTQLFIDYPFKLFSHVVVTGSVPYFIDFVQLLGSKSNILKWLGSWSWWFVDVLDDWMLYIFFAVGDYMQIIVAVIVFLELHFFHLVVRLPLALIFFRRRCILKTGQFVCSFGEIVFHPSMPVYFYILFYKLWCCRPIVRWIFAYFLLFENLNVVGRNYSMMHGLLVFW